MCTAPPVKEWFSILLFLSISLPSPSIVVPTLVTRIVGDLPGLCTTNLLHIARIIQQQVGKFNFVLFHTGVGNCEAFNSIRPNVKYF